MEKKLHLYNSKSDYLNEKDSFTPIYNVSYVIDTDEVLYNYVSRQGDTPIVFADSEVKRLCVENWGSGGEITYNQAAAVTDLGGVFGYNTAITSFDELQYFTGLTSIGVAAFDDCSNLKSVKIPNSVTIIKESAFFNCISLKSISMPNGITKIENIAFTNCPSLASVTMPNNLTSIGVGVFDGCTSLTSITIPNNLTSIGGAAFYNCSSLKTITSLAMSAPTITNSTFQGLPTGGTLYVPSGATGYDVWMGTGDYYLGKYNWALSAL